MDPDLGQSPMLNLAAAHGWAFEPQSLPILHQYQVLIKPSPDNIQGIYLDSLRVLGICPEERYSLWRITGSAAVETWGTGWEVWLDGMEIPSLPTFNSVEESLCRPVSIEITGWSDWLCISAS